MLFWFRVAVFSSKILLFASRAGPPNRLAFSLVSLLLNASAKRFILFRRRRFEPNHFHFPDGFWYGAESRFPVFNRFFFFSFLRIDWLKKMTFRHTAGSALALGVSFELQCVEERYSSVITAVLRGLFLSPLVCSRCATSPGDKCFGR